jgi:hypothetical protein
MCTGTASTRAADPWYGLYDMIMLLAGMIKVLSMNYDSGIPSRNHEAEVSVQIFLGRRKCSAD